MFDQCFILDYSAIYPVIGIEEFLLCAVYYLSQDHFD